MLNALSVTMRRKFSFTIIPPQIIIKHIAEQLTSIIFMVMS